MKALNKIATIILVFVMATVPSFSQRSGGRGGDHSRNRTSVAAPQRQSHAAPARHEAPSTRGAAPGHCVPAQSTRPSAGALRGDHRPHPAQHRPAHHYAPVRPVPAHHHHHGRPHYVPHIDRRAVSFYVDNCRYYHHNGLFYRYYPGYGYGLVTIPYNSCFPVLPFPCRQVIVGSAVYWEGDGTWFCEVPGGYALVEAPAVPVYEAPVPPAPVVVPAKPHVSVHLSF